MFAWPAVASKPPNHPKHADGARRNECHVPAIANGHPRNDERSENGPDIGSGVEESGGEGPLFLRKPFGDGFDGGGEVSGFSKPEQEACHSEAHSRTRQSVPH